MEDSLFEEIESSKIQYLFNGELILLVTATKLESKYVHQRLKPLAGFDKLLIVFEGNFTYYIGMFGKYRVVHVQSAMGSISRSSSIMTVSTALSVLNIKVVIMVGIGFGIDSIKHKVGDVLISTSVIPYNIRRVGSKKTIHRGHEAQSSQVLLNRFENLNNWNNDLGDGKIAEKIYTKLLSGEDLIDNLKYRQQLSKEFEDSQGGEMEGIGVYTACVNKKADWIIVKGICDFADGNKSVDKENNQIIAVNSSLNACEEIFETDTAFKELGILPHSETSNIILKDYKKISEVLFDIYDISKELYYLERSIDVEFNNILDQFGIWIYGPSGCGKSNLITRNLIKDKKNYIQISLATCIGENTDAFFDEILYGISSHTKGITSQIEPKSFAQYSKILFELLKNHYSDKEFIIFIEEIPISNDTSYKNFSDKLFALIIEKNYFPELSRVKFVLSSLNNPKVHIESFQQKIHQQVNFLEMNYWEGTELSELIQRIENEINFHLPDKIRADLMEHSKGSPRFVKIFFRSVIALNKTDNNTLEFVLRETRQELI